MAVLLPSCSSTEILKVRQFHLKSIALADSDAKMIRGEQRYRLRGAVTIEERQARLGQYYTVSWVNDAIGEGEMKLVMDFEQVATGSKILRMHRNLPAGEKSGQVEFRVAGDSYRVGGKVLSWRIRLLRAGKIIAEKRSYLWR